MKVNASKKIIRRVVCFAKALGVYEFDLTVTRESGDSFCERHENGAFTINVSKHLRGYWLLAHLAHEMVHLKQYKRDELVGQCDSGITYWKGQKFFPVDHMSDEYFLSPWEMEARAMESWLIYKWETRSELH